MKELGEIFEYNGRELVAMKSEEGCDGCYFNQRGTDGLQVPPERRDRTLRTGATI